MKGVFKKLKERQEQMQDQEMKQKQQQLDQQQQQMEAQLAQAQAQYDSKIANDNYQAELDRLNKVQIAMIAAESKAGPLSDVDTSGTPDVLEMNKLAAEQNKASTDYHTKMAEIQSRSRTDSEKMALEREKLQVERENHANDIKVAEINARNRASKSK
jgi:hypothetical protein